MLLLCSHKKHSLHLCPLPQLSCKEGVRDIAGCETRERKQEEMREKDEGRNVL